MVNLTNFKERHHFTNNGIVHLENGQSSLFLPVYFPFQQKVILLKFLFVKYNFFLSQGMKCTDPYLNKQSCLLVWKSRPCRGYIFCCVNNDIISYKIFVPLISCVIINHSISQLRLRYCFLIHCSQRSWRCLPKYMERGWKQSQSSFRINCWHAR